MDETLKSALTDAVITCAQDAGPSVYLEQKYGGTVFLTRESDASSLAAGVYSYKDHVSVEFSKGADFDDPDSLLVGKGKARRHIKLHSLGDLNDKDCAGFLKQALAG